MKRAFYIALAITSLSLVACEQDIYQPIDFEVTLNPQNTYVAGDPVTFDFSGNADYLIAYSGETGAEYRFHERTEVAMEDLESCKLKLEVQARYGVAGALDYYVAKGFTGLKGNDAQADYDALKTEEQGGFANWDQLTYEEGASTKWTSHEYDITQYADNFCLAFHWKPESFTVVQRTYYIKPSLSVKFKGYDAVTVSAADLGFGAIGMTDASAADRYKINAGNGSVVLNKPATADIIMQGVGANVLSYCLNSWVISTPRKLNSITPDSGINIKGMSDDVTSYTYTYEKAGTYTASFVATSANYQGSSRVVKEVTFTVVDRITEE